MPLTAILPFWFYRGFCSLIKESPGEKLLKKHPHTVRFLEQNWACKWQEESKTTSVGGERFLADTDDEVLATVSIPASLKIHSLPQQSLKKLLSVLLSLAFHSQDLDIVYSYQKLLQINFVHLARKNSWLNPAALAFSVTGLPFCFQKGNKIL